MSHLLHIEVSPAGENSISRGISQEFLSAYVAAHPETAVITRDFSTNPIPHLDDEAIFAGYTPEESRSASAQAKHSFRLELIEEIKNANDILVSTPMWNWNVPSVLKAYIDQIIVPGVLYGAGADDSLKAKRVTVVVSQGGSYVAGPRQGWDYETGYLKQVFTALGAKDVEVILSEFGLAGLVPGMDDFVTNKNESIAAAKAAAKTRGSLN